MDFQILCSVYIARHTCQFAICIDQVQVIAFIATLFRLTHMLNAW